MFRFSLNLRSTILTHRFKRSSHFDAKCLEQCPANFVPLNPLSLFNHTVRVYPTSVAYVHGNTTKTWSEVSSRVKQLASSLNRLGVCKNDVVAIISPNAPAIFESHFAVPGTNAVLLTLNTRLDATTLSFQLRHSNTKVLLVDSELSELMANVIEHLQNNDSSYKKPFIIDIHDSDYIPKDTSKNQPPLGVIDYESFIEGGDSNFNLIMAKDEWEAITLNYTSGTTGNPKGVVTHYRGAYINAISNIVGLNMGLFPKYLWVVPMFHCNGWCFPWTMAATAGTSFFLRQIRGDIMFDLIEKHKIQFMAGAPVTMNTMLASPNKKKFDFSIQMMCAGAPPPPPLIKRFKNEIGIHVRTAYGLTETYGPIAIHSPDLEWSQGTKPLNEDELLQKSIYLSQNSTLEEMVVMNPETMQKVPADGSTIGEVMIRGNIVMKGYLDNEKATNESFQGGYFHTGDLAVQHPNGRLEIRDRSKDIIISGGENISSIEVENIMLTHPRIMEVAVVAKPDERWGEVPCAFVHLRSDDHSPTNDGLDGDVSEEGIIKWCRSKMAAFQSPKKIVFLDLLPKTSTGKVQKNILRQKIM